jgi:hypothetical protein
MDILMVTQSTTIFKNGSTEFRGHRCVATFLLQTFSSPGATIAPEHNPKPCKGEISLPILGNVQVYGLTMNEVKRAIEERAAQYLKDAVVNVRLLSLQVHGDR